MTAPPMRWPTVAVVAVGAGAIATMITVAGWTGRLLRERANAEAAQAVAGYLTLVTRVGADGRYDPAHLLSTASVLSGPSFRGAGLQVAWEGTTLLPDSVGLGRLDPATEARMVDGQRTVMVALRNGRTAAVVPLLDRDLWDTRGWVAVWGVVPPEADPARLVLVVLALGGLLATAFLAASERRPDLFRAGRIATAMAGAALALHLGLSLRRTAIAATDEPLLRARRLIEIAATGAGVREDRLVRIVPAARTDADADPAERQSGVTRRTTDGQPEAEVIATTRSGDAMRIRVVPAETGLELSLAGQGGAWLVLLAALALTGWSVRAPRDRAAFRQTVAAWGFLAPAAVHLALFSFLPVAFAVYLAFHRWGLVQAVRPFAGLDNFRMVFTDPAFWHSLWVTAVYSLYVPVAAALALAAAVALDRGGVRVRVVRTILFLPFISSVVAVALVWQWLYQPDFGLINSALRLFGLRGPDWLGDPRTALAAVMLMSIWVQFGYQMVIFLAGLQAIPQTYLDAARVDGAGAWQRFRWVTLPLLRPTLLFVLVTGVLTSFQVFTYISVMTEGGPLYATDVVVYRIYQEAWEFLRFGTASAMSLVLLLVLVGITWLHFRWLGRRVELV